MAPTRTTTIITPADSYDLVTLDDLKSDLSIVGTGDDEYLARAISKASLAAARYCDRTLVAETVEDRFDLGWSSPSTLSLSHFPVIDLQTVSQDGAALVADVDYWLDASSGGLTRIGCGWGGATILVRYEGGYEDIPLDLQGAATDIVKALQFNRTRDPLLRSENILSGLYAYTLFDGSSGASAGTAMQVRSTLDSYRVITV